MKENARMILIVVALLIGVGILTVLLPFLVGTLDGGEVSEGAETALAVENNPVVIDLSGYLLGEEIAQIPQVSELVDGVAVNPLIVFAVVFALLAGAVVTTGVVLALVTRLLDRATTRTKSDPGFVSAANTLEQRTKEENKALAESRPPTPIPEHNRPRRNAITTAAVILLFVIFGAILTFSTLRPDLTVEFAGAVWPFWVPATLFVFVLTLVILAFTMRSSRFADIDQREKLPVNWSVIWVTISGLIFIGIGTGLVIAIRSGGG